MHTTLNLPCTDCITGNARFGCCANMNGLCHLPKARIAFIKLLKHGFEFEFSYKAHAGAVRWPAKRPPCPDEPAELGGGVRVRLEFFVTFCFKTKSK